jgi:predicted DNA-binding transcriptional regulator AlpA
MTDQDTAANSNAADNYLRLADVIKMAALSRSAIYRRMAEATFPVAFDIGGGSVRWLESEILGWKASHRRSRAA